MYDERFTSVLAHRAMIDGGMKKKDRQDKAVVDKIAAQQKDGADRPLEDIKIISATIIN